MYWRLFIDADWQLQFIALSAPLLFRASAPAAQRWRGAAGLVLLWCGFIAPLVALGWYQWREAFTAESPVLPLFNISLYVLPIGASTAFAAGAVLHARRRTPEARFGFALLAAYAPLPIIAPLALYLSFWIYAATGGSMIGP